jgi:hypothetical protein
VRELWGLEDYDVLDNYTQRMRAAAEDSQPARRKEVGV